MKNFILITLIALCALLAFVVSTKAQDTAKVVATFSNLNALNQNTQGWAAEGSAKIYRYDRFKFEGFAQVNGHYEGGDSVHQLLAGPQLSYTVANRVSPFVRGLFGSTYYEGNSFTKGVGFGADLHFGRFLVRPAVIDFQWINSAPGVRFTRFGTGVGFRF